MEKRLTIAIILTILFMIAYQEIVLKKYSKKPQTKIVEKKQIEKKESKNIKKEKEIKKIHPEILPKSEIKGEKEKNIIINTNLYRATFSTRGGVLKSFIILKHKDSRGNPFEMVSNDSSKKGIYPFSLYGKEFEIFNTSIYKEKITKKEDKTIVELIYSDTSGNYSYKKFILHKSSYSIDVSFKTILSGKELSPPILYGPNIGFIHEEDKKTNLYEFGRSFKYYAMGKVEKVKVEKLKEDVSFSPNYLWAGFSIKYFTVIALSQKRKGSFSIHIEPYDKNKKDIYVAFSNVDKFYIGPKESKRLEEFAEKADSVIDYGFFGFIAKLLLKGIVFFYGIFPNYGVAIIIVTFILKLLLFPLTYSSSISMAKMQEIQPEIKKIQRKYKKFGPKDLEAKKRMNQEIMELYKSKGINPAGGCFPILLQIPFFWGFFRLLSVAIEIRHKPFILWIKDLSQKDPYYILPILMGLTQIVISKMTPSTGSDKNQKLMSYGMSIFFTFIFANFQSGLVLYWLTNNILQIGQQYIINKIIEKKKQEEKKRGKK